jgi:triacylglycerol lipase
MATLRSDSFDVRPPAKANQETVVLLHGLGLGSWAMWRMAWALRRNGYRVINLSYPSRTVPVAELAREWLPRRLREHGLPRPDATAGALHFVTHSMGGIVVRGWLKAYGVPNQLGRVVMVAPPNQGTPLVDRIRAWWLFHLFTGINGGPLGTDEKSFPIQLGSWPEGPELGIIAGDRPFFPFLARCWSPGPCDGKVTVTGTMLEGQQDHLVLPHSHTWIQYCGDTIAQALEFLKDGRFSRPARIWHSSPSPAELR